MLKTQRQPALRKTDVSGCGYWSSVVYWVVCRLKKKRGGRKFFLGLGKGKLFTHFYWLCVVAKMRNVLACVLDCFVCFLYSNSKVAVTFPEPSAVVKPVTSSIVPNFV